MSHDGSHSPGSAQDPLGATPAPMPHNLEAEQALLGAILHDNEVLHRITQRLEAQHFYDPVHGRIFAVARALVFKNRLADGVTLRDQFENDKALAEIGGAQYLLFLIDRMALMTSQAQEYAELVLDLALRRDLIRIAGEVTTEAQDLKPETSAFDAIENTEKKLFLLAETGSPQAGFRNFSTAIAGSMDLVKDAIKRGGKIAGVSSGFVDLDRALGGLRPSDLLILAGRPAMGKTALALNIAYAVALARHRANQDLARSEGPNPDRATLGVGFFSLEMSAEQLALRVLSDRSCISSKKIMVGDLNQSEYSRLVEAAREIEGIPLHIDETGGISIAALAARARRLKRSNKGLDLIVIDYLQLVTSASNRRSDGRVQEVSEVTQGLKALAKELKVPVLALSQLSRKVEEREDKRPQLSDLRESGSIEQDADIVMFVYREAYYLLNQQPQKMMFKSEEEFIRKYDEWEKRQAETERKAEVIIGKHRHGSPGKVELAFDSEFTRFSNLARDSRFLSES